MRQVKMYHSWQVKAEAYSFSMPAPSTTRRPAHAMCHERPAAACAPQLLTRRGQPRAAWCKCACAQPRTHVSPAACMRRARCFPCPVLLACAPCVPLAACNQQCSCVPVPARSFSACPSPRLCAGTPVPAKECMHAKAFPHTCRRCSCLRCASCAHAQVHVAASDANSVSAKPARLRVRT